MREPTGGVASPHPKKATRYPAFRPRYGGKRLRSGAASARMAGGHGRHVKAKKGGT
jgi:hypothetical protein